MLGDLLLAGYRGLGSVARPLVPLVLRRRLAQGKELPARVNERYGIASLSRPSGPLVWVHAASVGETNAVMPLIRRLVADGVQVLFTSTTVTSASIAETALPHGALHQFGPLDAPAYVDAFLAHWRPDLAIFVESELWPTILVKLERASIPFVTVNGRMSDRSYRGWKRFGCLSHALFPRISLCLAQSAEDGARYRGLGAQNVVVTGNIKFDTPPLAVDDAAFAALMNSIGGRPVWVAASTHEGEEDVVADAHVLLSAARPDVLTILVPRHPVRGDAIRAMLQGKGLRVAQRSRQETPDASTNVYLADTLGELGLFYRAAPVTFLGGSLAPIGGHNPIEPVRLGAAVIHGPHVGNFAELFALLDSVTPSARIADAASLAAAVRPLMEEPDAGRAQAAVVEKAFAPLSGALDATISALHAYLPQR